MSPTTERLSIAVFRTGLLPISETFIKAQAEAIQAFDVFYAGFYPITPSLPLDRDRVLLGVFRNRISGWMTRLYREVGVAPYFYSQLRAKRPSLIHAHFATDGVDAIRISKRLGVPLVVTLHGFDVTARRDFSTSYGELWRHASRFLCISEFIKRKAIEAGFPEDKLTVHSIGIDLTQFKRTAPGGASDGKGVLFVGRLVEKKGCQVLIRAMSLVQRELPGAALTIIGDGPLRQPLEDEAKALGVKCSFLGARDSSYIRQRMEETAVFCAPSMEAANGDGEGLGIVFLEAQALGVPVVSTTHGGIPEAVQHERGGLLSIPGDCEALAENLLRYLQNESLRKAAGLAGMAFVQEGFELGKQTKILEGIYNKVLTDFT